MDYAIYGDRTQTVLRMTLTMVEKGGSPTPKHKLLESDLLEMQAKFPRKPMRD